MCLAIPAKVTEIEGFLARVEVYGNIREVGTRLVPDLKVGDWVLIHAGFALEKIDEERAMETLKILEEMAEAVEKEEEAGA
ncbi:MAG: HypC/HybG/HupF family hydrogenase formation chaperone [Firmicutes bacterium]|nr:HypC/HybG/HupF family hydrogenase formation chaperone [Bacillota bacterium]